MSMKFTPVGDTKGHLQVGSGLPVEIDTAGNLSTPGNVRAAPATADGDVVTFEQAFGVGQTWQNVTDSRAVGVTYTNLTGKTIWVHASAAIQSDGFIQLLTNGVVVDRAQNTDGRRSSVTGPIPPGETYSFLTQFGTFSEWYFSELR